MAYMANVLLRPVRMGRNLHRPACAAAPDPDVAAVSAAKTASKLMGTVTSQLLPPFCFLAISSAHSMLSTCTATLKRAAPLLT